MSEQIDWSKAPEGATHYYPPTREWYLAGYGCAPLVWTGMWCKAFQFAQREHKCIERPATPSWSGEGLPPVGVVCEFKSPSSGGWLKARIIFVSAWTVVLYVFFEHDEHCYSVSAFEKGNLQFRPIRTPEQIAHDKREAAINEMSRDSNFIGLPNRILLGGLYDAGYRKQSTCDPTGYGD